MKNDSGIEKIIMVLLMQAFFLGSIVADQPPDAGKRPVQIRFSYSIDGYSRNMPFNSPAAFCLDEKHNELLIADTGNNAIGIFAADTGEYKGRLDSAVPLQAPCGIAIDAEDSIYVACSDSSVIEIFDFKGTNLGGIDVSGAGQKTPVKPGKLYWDGLAEELYVIDRANQQVLICKDRKVWQKIQPLSADAAGNADWKNAPMLQDIAVDDCGKIYVISSIGNAVAVFDRNGSPVTSFGRHGDTADTVSFPVAVSIDKKNRLWIIDNFRHCITVFDAQGKYITACGAYGADHGNLFFPVDIIVKDGALYVLEKGAERVQVFAIVE
ncbi:MAG: NHL repeat-containing protein [Planctomycetes bacterium]|nr:NHL repeat-containing protein [Planctomycetota bacterium]